MCAEDDQGVVPPQFPPVPGRSTLPVFPLEDRQDGVSPRNRSGTSRGEGFSDTLDQSTTRACMDATWTDMDALQAHGACRSAVQSAMEADACVLVRCSNKTAVRTAREALHAGAETAYVVQSEEEGSEEDGYVLVCGKNKFGDCHADTLQRTSRMVTKLMHVEECTPLHAPKDRHEALANAWVRPKGWKEFLRARQPLDEVFSLYGARVAMYFRFLGHYTRALRVPTLLGLATFLLERIGGRWQALVRLTYALALPLWATAFLEHWKRACATTAHRWRQLHDRAPPRAKQLAQRLAREPWKQMAHGWIIAALFACNCGLLFFMDWTRQFALPLVTQTKLAKSFPTYESLIMTAASTGHTVLSILFSTVFLNGLSRTVAQKLNERERHVDLVAKENGLLAKVSIFYFCNMYSTLFFYCFYLQDMEKLTAWLSTLLVTKQIIGNLTEVALPFTTAKLLPSVSQRLSSWRSRDRLGECDGAAIVREDIVFIKGELAKPAYDAEEAEDGLFDDYLEMAFQFGYVVMFSAAFPLGSLCAFINDVVEVRSDAFKITRLCRMSVPEGAVGIGAWLNILGTMGFVSIITNGFIVCFVTDWLDVILGRPLDILEKTIVFFALEHVLLAFKYTVEFLIDDISLAVLQDLAREEEMSSKKWE